MVPVDRSNFWWVERPASAVRRASMPLKLMPWFRSIIRPIVHAVYIFSRIYRALFFKKYPLSCLTLKRSSSIVPHLPLPFRILLRCIMRLDVPFCSNCSCNSFTCFCAFIISSVTVSSFAVTTSWRSRETRSLVRGSDSSRVSSFSSAFFCSRSLVISVLNCLTSISFCNFASARIDKRESILQLSSRSSKPAWNRVARNNPAAMRRVTRGVPHDERNVLSSSSFTSLLDALFFQEQPIDAVAAFSMLGWTFAAVDEALCCCNGGGTSVFNGVGKIFNFLVAPYACRSWRETYLHLNAFSPSSHLLGASPSRPT
jgi:hypothetical protein